MADLFVRLNCTLFVWRTIRVKQIHSCREQVQRSWATQVRGRFAPLFLTAPPYPHSCDQSPVKNRPVRITGELFPGDIKEQSVKQKQ